MSVPPPSAAQIEANRQAQTMRREVERYRSILPKNERHHGGGGVCRSDGWNVSYRQLDGDFDLDEVLAKNLIGNALEGS